MCLYYPATRKEPFTRLCHRYGSMRGTHVPGRWRCGEYPKPGRAQRAAGTSGPARKSNPKEQDARACRCGNPAVSQDGWCEQCYVYDQLVRLPEEARKNVDPDLLRRAEEMMGTTDRRGGG